MSARPRRLLRVGMPAAAIAALLFVAGCCFGRRPIALGPAHRFPPASALVLEPPPTMPASDTVAQASMRNILFHLDDDTSLHIYRMQGRIHDLRHTGVITLDDKNTLLLEIEDGVMGMAADDLTRLLNRYVFGYRGSPLHDLRVTLPGSRMEMTGVLHKGVDLAFQMTATVALTPEGQIRVHATSVKMCGADGLVLLRALHLDLADMIDLRGARGVRAEGNDLVLDPFQILPPPRIEGRLTQVRVENGEMVQVFGRESVRPTPGPVAAENYLYFRGGTLRFGKLFMVQADMEAIDSDASDLFDFYLDYYNSQLVAGYHVTTESGGMVAYFPDFDDLGTPAGVRHPPSVPSACVAPVSPSGRAPRATRPPCAPTPG